MIWARTSPHQDNPVQRTETSEFLMQRMRNRFGVSLLLWGVLSTSGLLADNKPVPVAADVSYGPHPHQLLDIYVPTKGNGPFPVLIWYGGIWEPSKHVPDLNHFLPEQIAVIGVQTRTLTDGMKEQATPPVSYVMNDACRAVQFVRWNAAKWNLDPQRIAAGGSSQGALPALYVGGAADHADPTSDDPVARVSSRVTCVAAHRSQPSIDPQRMQQWVPGVKWGAPSLGCGFEESLKRRDELLPLIEKWSPDALLRQGAAPIYFENNWGLTQPENVTENDHKVHSPAWGLGFQKLAQQAGVVCCVKFPGHPTDGYKDFRDFITQELQPDDRPDVATAHLGPLALAVQPFMDDHTIAGAVMLVATSDRILDIEVLGYADPFTRQPMTENAVFRLASITKTFTAVSVTMLQDQGKLNVDDPVANYLPEFKAQRVGVDQPDGTVVQQTTSHPLLIRELLSHMSGFTNTPRHDETLALEQQSKNLAAEPLPFDPGTHYEYCNKNFTVLGRLIEVVSGTSYAGFIKTNITDPLGMKDTTFWPTSEQLGRLVEAYGSIDHEPWFTPRDIFRFDPSSPPTVPHPAGGILSTATDLASYGQMLLNGGVLDGRRYLTESAVRQMSSTQTEHFVDKNGENGYGFGFSTTRYVSQDRTVVSPGAFGHGGAWSTDLWIDPQRKLVMIILMQQAGYLPGKDRGLIIKPYRDRVYKVYANRPEGL